MARTANLWLGLWFLMAVIGFAVSLALAQSSIQEIVVAAVGLVVAAIIFVSCLTALARMTSAPGSAWPPVDRPSSCS